MRVAALHVNGRAHARARERESERERKCVCVYEKNFRVCTISHEHDRGINKLTRTNTHTQHSKTAF